MDGKGIVERLEKVFNVNGNRALAESLGGSDTAISNWRTGYSNPKLDSILKKVEPLGVNLHWLLTGKGEMFIKNIPGQSEAAEREEKAGKLLAEAIQLLSQRNRITPTEVSIAKGETCQTFDIIEVPLYIHTVAAGLPADSTGNVEESFDLPRHMVCHPTDTYAVRACGDSMIGAGIEEDDILIVDKALEPQSNNIVIASINGEQTVKRLIVQEESIYLAPENHKYPITEITEEMDFRTLGVVTWVIRRTG